LLIGFHLHKIAFLQQFGELLLRQRQDMLRGFLELLLLVRVDVRPLFWNPYTVSALRLNRIMVR
jgi:hypothetical protein